MIKKEQIKEGMWFTMDCNGLTCKNGEPLFLLRLKDAYGNYFVKESKTDKILFRVNTAGFSEGLLGGVYCAIFREGFNMNWNTIRVADICELGTKISLSKNDIEMLEVVEGLAIRDSNTDRDMRVELKLTEECCKEYGFKHFDHNIKEALKNEKDFMVIEDKWIKECEKDFPKAKKDLENIISNKMVGKSHYAEGQPLISKDIVRFGMITKKMRDMFERKNKDYGNSFKDLYKKHGMKYSFIHLSEKLKRIETLMDDEAKVEGESMKDSLYDLANYAVLTIMELERKENNGRKNIHRD